MVVVRQWGVDDEKIPNSSRGDCGLCPVIASQQDGKADGRGGATEPLEQPEPDEPLWVGCGMAQCQPLANGRPTVHTASSAKKKCLWHRDLFVPVSQRRSRIDVCNGTYSALH